MQTVPSNLKKQGRTNCTALECGNYFGTTETVHFFRFPKDPLLCNEWIKNVKNPNTQFMCSTKLHVSRRLCSDHFEECMFIDSTKRRLKKTAVPTIFSGSSNSKDERKRITAPTNTFNEKLFKSNCQVRRYKMQARRAEINALKYKMKAKSLLQKLQACNGICSQVREMPSNKNLFVKTQIKASRCKTLGMRWPVEVKNIACALQYKSPSCYKLLREVLYLPSKATLNSFVKSINLHPGICEDLLTALKLKLDKMTELDRYASITFDAMAIKQRLTYIESTDQIHGFVNLGNVLQNANNSIALKVATHAFVVMLRGITNPWKQTIGFFFIHNTVKPEMLQTILNAAVTRVEEIGVRVQCVICDLEINQRLFFRLQGCTTSRHWITNPYDISRKLYIIYDPPHLIKCCRNALRKYDIQFGNKVASWRDIVNLWHLEYNSPLRLAPKLTPSHIFLPAFSEMRVKLATQVMSHSVSSALKTYVHFSKLSDTSLDTADFVDKMNCIFDLMNTRSLQDAGSKKPITKQKISALQQFTDYAQWIESWKFVFNGAVSKQFFPFHDGLVITLKSLRELISYLFQQKFLFVLTSRFSQDPIENMFGCIRYKGGCQENPTTFHFIAALKNYIICNYMKPGFHCNTQLDDDILVGIENIKPIVKRKSVQLVSQQINNCNASPLDITSACNNQDYNNQDYFVINNNHDFIQSNILYYICGYIVQKVRFQCPMCHYVLQSSNDDCFDLQKESVFLNYKMFSTADCGLHRPSLSFLKLCQQLENIFQKSIFIISLESRVKQQLQQKFRAEIDYSSYFSAHSIHSENICKNVELIFLRIRIHFFVRTRNQQLVEERLHNRRNRKNRKMQKIIGN